MPKSPIIERTMFFTKLPGGQSAPVVAGYRFMDWNIVETALGAMVEPRALNMMPQSDAALNLDVFDAAPTRILEMNEDTFYAQYNTYGDQLGRDYNR